MARKKPDKVFYVKKDDILYKKKRARTGLPALKKFIRIISADNYNGVFVFETINLRIGVGAVAYASFVKSNEKTANRHQWRFGFDEMNTFKKPSQIIKRNTIKGLFQVVAIHTN